MNWFLIFPQVGENQPFYRQIITLNLHQQTFLIPSAFINQLQYYHSLMHCITK